MISMSGSSGAERRHFPRVNFRGHASLITTHNKWPVHIIDLSFNGALVAVIHKHTIADGEGIMLSIETEDGDIIKMQGEVAHQKEHFLGVVCRATSIDHQARLRELVNKYENPPQMARSLANILADNDD
ncbi:MAG: PilZ domain-containing protein [Cellvibrionaceae bacterium]